MQCLGVIFLVQYCGKVEQQLVQLGGKEVGYIIKMSVDYVDCLVFFVFIVDYGIEGVDCFIGYGQWCVVEEQEKEWCDNIIYCVFCYGFYYCMVDLCWLELRGIVFDNSGEFMLVFGEIFGLQWLGYCYC